MSEFGFARGANKITRPYFQVLIGLVLANQNMREIPAVPLIKRLIIIKAGNKLNFVGCRFFVGFVSLWVPFGPYQRTGLGILRKANQDAISLQDRIASILVIGVYRRTRLL